MSRFISVLAESFNLLLKKPKLFLPKIFISAVYGVSMLLVAQLYLQVYSIGPVGITQRAISPETLASLLFLVLINFIVLVFAFLLDILINGMYPSMVNDYFEKKEISFKTALDKSLKRFFVLLPITLLDVIVFTVISIPLSFALYFALQVNNIFLIIPILLIIGVMIFLTIIIFYFLYPVTMLEKEGIIRTVVHSFKSSYRNLGPVSKASLIPFFISLLNFALAFLQENLGFLILFIVMRFVVALISTYHYVLNPTVYLEYEKHKVVK